MSTHLIFEHPLNERIRTFLRIEHLCERINHFAPQYDAWASRVAVETLLDLAAITSRPDLKSEIIKELERHLGTLRRMADQPGVDPRALDRVMSDISEAIAGIEQLVDPIGQLAREDDFLKGIAQRSNMPGGSCSFDLPYFHFWLTRSPETRQAHLERWLADVRPGEHAIGLILSLIRTSSPSREMVAAGGFFQQALETQAPAQMLRVAVPGASGPYPEISGHKGRFSIRFLSAEADGRQSQVTADVPFRLTCCIF